MNEKTLILLDQIIEAAERDEALITKHNLDKNKAGRTIGEGFVVFHLKVLKELIKEKNNGND